MVTRLPDPSLIPTSQHAGNVTADNSAAMTAPGSPSQSVAAGMIAAPPRLEPSGAKIPVPDTRQPSASPPGTGRAWKYTPASGRR